jgi:hypothetical protein
MTPHDEWGYGGSNENILVELTIHGAPVKALVHFDRNGFAYTLDRATGRALVAERFGPANWAQGVDLGSGLPRRIHGMPRPPLRRRPPPARRDAHRRVLPPPASAPEVSAPSFSSRPRSRRSPTCSILPLNNLCMDLRIAASAYVAGEPFSGATIRMTAGPGAIGAASSRGTRRPRPSRGR